MLQSVCATLATWRNCICHAWLHKCHCRSSYETVTEQYIKYIHLLGLMACPKPQKIWEVLNISSSQKCASRSLFLLLPALPWRILLFCLSRGECSVSSGSEAHFNTFVFSPIIHHSLTTLFLQSPIQGWQLSSNTLLTHAPSQSLPLPLPPLHTFSFLPLLCTLHRSAASSGTVLLQSDGIWFVFLG